MNGFKLLFGTQNRNIKKVCVILPFMSKTISTALGSGKFEQGRAYKTAGNGLFSVIYTGIGPAQVGDAMLYLKDTACEYAILLGSCGSLPDSDSAKMFSVVCPQQAYSIENFSSMLDPSVTYWPCFKSDKKMKDDFLVAFDTASAVTCATTGSLKLEADHIKRFRSLKVDVVDMECSAFYSAASFSGIKALAILYISDVIEQKPFYRVLDKAEKDKLTETARQTAVMTCRFAEHLIAS